MKKTLFFILGILMCFIALFAGGCSEFKGDYKDVTIDEVSAFAVKVSGKETVNYAKGVNVEFELTNQSGEKVFKVRSIDNGNGFGSSGALIIKNGNEVEYTIEFWYAGGTLYTKTLYPHSDPVYATSQTDYTLFISGYTNGLNQLTLASMIYGDTAEKGLSYSMTKTGEETKVCVSVESNAYNTDSGNCYFVYDSFNRLQSIKAEMKSTYGNYNFELTPWKGEVESPDYNRFN